MDVTSGTAAVNGTQLYYEIAGEGHPLVLIHGFALDCRMWDAQFAFFSRSYRVIRYDLREFGRSQARSPQRFSQAEDLRALLEHLEAPKAHILGLSMGGRVALAYALVYPECTRSLILADAALEGFRFSDAFAASFAAISERGRVAGARAANELWFQHDLFAPARERENVAQALSDMIADYSGSFWIEENRERFLRPRAIERLTEVRAPTLVVVGQRDIDDFQRIATQLARDIPRARLARIPRAGHMCNMERPAEFNTIVLDFLRSRFLTA